MCIRDRDYAGPVLLRHGGQRSKSTTKAYIALFICMCTRAVSYTHLDVYKRQIVMCASLNGSLLVILNIFLHLFCFKLEIWTTFLGNTISFFLYCSCLL